MCGIGAGLNSTSAMAIVATHYKQEREKMIGLMESSAGVGLLMGPVVGSILYSIGGYILPFFSVGMYILFSNLIFSSFLFILVSSNSLYVNKTEIR